MYVCYNDWNEVKTKEIVLCVHGVHVCGKHVKAVCVCMLQGYDELNFVLCFSCDYGGIHVRNGS